MTARHDPFSPAYVGGPDPRCGERVVSGDPLDLPAIEQWDERNRRSRDAYALRQWQIRTNEMNADSKKKRKAVR